MLVHVSLIEVLSNETDRADEGRDGDKYVPLFHPGTCPFGASRHLHMLEFREIEIDPLFGEISDAEEERPIVRIELSPATRPTRYEPA